MNPTRYFALIYLQTHSSREAAQRSAEAAENAQKLVTHVRSIYPDAEAIFTHPNAVIFALMDSVPADDVWKKLAPGLRGNDLLSVVEVGRDIVANHPGLATWNSRTRFLAS